MSSYASFYCDDWNCKVPPTKTSIHCLRALFAFSILLHAGNTVQILDSTQYKDNLALKVQSYPDVSQTCWVCEISATTCFVHEVNSEVKSVVALQFEEEGVQKKKTGFRLKVSE